MVVSGSGKGNFGEASKDLRVARVVKGLELASVALEIVLDLSWIGEDIKCNSGYG